MTVNIMPQPSAPDEVVFSTKWFQIVMRKTAGSEDPHYLINSTDFVSIVAVNSQGKLLLVRQFRPAISGTSLELPSGHVETGETPEEAARKELLEETGHEGEKFELLAQLSPGIGRFTNRMWCYFVADARPVEGYEREAGIDLVLHTGSLQPLLDDREFCSALSCAGLFVAAAKGRVEINP
jgi:ADP-ribose pyrophosphatase